MDKIRKIARILHGHQTSDGAGVRLTRIFGFGEESNLDPFLLLDYFGSDRAEDFIAGFPWHPHRGIETVTYLVAGKVEHMDSIGNKGFLGTGDIQWMTAGSGIIHQEMPKPDGSRMFGFQLWVNLPSTHKMMKPRYQDIPAAKVPLVVLPDGVKVKVLAGQLDGTKGPVEDIILSPSYFDVEMPPDTIFTTGTEPDHTAFACIFEGEALFDETRGDSLKPLSGVLYEPGSQVRVRTGKNKARFILISGKPIREPVAWGGPIVMNTREELETAFREYREGTFIRK